MNLSIHLFGRFSKKYSTWSAFIFFLVITTAWSICMTLGPVVNVALGPHGRTAASYVAGIQAVAAVLALFFAKQERSGRKRFPLMLPMSLSIIGSILLSFENSRQIMLLGVLLRQTGGVILMSTLLSNLRHFSSLSLIQANKNAQFMNAAGVLFGYVLGPILVTSLGGHGTAIIDLTVSISLLPLGLHIEKFLKANPITSDDLDPLREGSKSHLVLGFFLTSVSVWVLAGIMNIVEVPLMMQDFKIPTYLISCLFLAAGLSSLIGVGIFPSQVLAKNPRFWTVVFGIGMMLCSLGLIYSQSLKSVTAALILAGFTNGLFNLSQSSIIQAFQNEKMRSSSYIMSRLGMNIGVLFASFIVADKTTTKALAESTSLMFLPLFGSLIVGIIITSELSFLRKPMKAEMNEDLK